MVITKLISDAPILKPNKEHQNFTESDLVLKKGTKIKGDFKIINGLRRGKPFPYKIFITSKEDIIYSKNVEPMETREVTLGADAQVTGTKVNLIPAEKKTKYIRLASTLGGVVAGYLVAKKMKKDSKKTLLFALAGGLVGFGASKMLTKSDKISVQKSK
jgi:hypothetical protein